MADTHETIADIIAEMRGMGNYQRYSGDHARVLANRFEAAHRRERGDAAKLREAVVHMIDTADSIAMREPTGAIGKLAFHIKHTGNAALSAPPRNCDLPKVVEDPWRAWLDDESNWKDGNPKLEIHDWLLATTTEKEGGNNG